MSTQSVARRGLLAPGALAAVLLGTAPLLSACGTGKNAPTRVEYEVAEGVQAAAGNVVLRNLQLVGDTGGTQGGATTLEITGSIANNTAQTDTLTSVTATVAGAQVAFRPATSALPSATSTKTAASTTPAPSASAGSASAGAPSASVGVVPPSELASAGQTPPSSPPVSGSSSASASGTASGAPSSAAITSGAAPTGLPAKITPEQPLVLGGIGPRLQISGLKDPVLPGSQIQVTFTFQQSGTTTVAVPVYSLASRTGAPASSRVTYPKPEIPRDFNEPEYDLRSAAPSS